MTSLHAQSRGFSLIELMIALFLGLIVTLGITNIFISAKNTYLTQNAAAGMQEDARFILSKMVQEIRMTGMFGCLGTVTPDATAPDFLAAFNVPVVYVTGGSVGTVLTLITADIGAGGGTPTWTVLSDCVTSATAYPGTKAPATGQIAFPIRKVIYTWANNQISTTVGTGTPQVLVSNVSNFTVMFGVATSATDPVVNSYVSAITNQALIRTIRLTLTMTDPANKAKSEPFSVVATLRNRVY